MSVAIKKGLGTQLLTGGLALASRSVIGSALSAISLLVYTRFLGVAEYGAFAAALGLVMLAANVAQSGISVSVVRQQKSAADNAVLDGAFTLLALFGVAAGGALCVAAATLPVFVASPSAARALQLMAFAVPISVVSQLASGILDRNLAFRDAAICELLGQVAYLAVGIGGLLVWGSATALATAWVAQQVVFGAAAFRRSRYVPRALCIRPALPLLLSGIRYAASLWIWQLRTAVPSLVIAPLAGFEAVAQLAIATRIVEVAGSARTAIWRVSLAGIARIQDDHATILRTVAASMHLQVMGYGVLLTGAGLLMPLLAALLGKEWSDVSDLFPYLAIGALANSAFSIHSAVLYAKNHDLEVGIFHVAHLMLLIAAAVALVPYVGLIGYGWAEIVAIGAYSLLTVALRRRVGPVAYRDFSIAFLGLALALLLTPLGPVAVTPIIVLAALNSTRTLAMSVGRHLAHAVKSTV